DDGTSELLALTVTGAGDTLLLDAASDAKSLSFNSSTGTLGLSSTGTVKLDGSSSTLTDPNGVTLTTGTITGVGKVAAAVTASGAASITANGGVLEVTGAIDDGTSELLALTVTGAGDTLLLDAAS